MCVYIYIYIHLLIYSHIPIYICIYIYIHSLCNDTSIIPGLNIHKSLSSLRIHQAAANPRSSTRTRRSPTCCDANCRWGDERCFFLYMAREMVSLHRLIYTVLILHTVWLLIHTVLIYTVWYIMFDIYCIFRPVIWCDMCLYALILWMVAKSCATLDGWNPGNSGPKYFFHPQYVFQSISKNQDLLCFLVLFQPTKLWIHREWSCFLNQQLFQACECSIPCPQPAIQFSLDLYSINISIT